MTEGAPLYFIIRAEPAPLVDLSVGVTIAYGGCDLVQRSEAVTIPSSHSSITLKVPSSRAAGCTVVVTLAASESYRGSGLPTARRPALSSSRR